MLSTFAWSPECLIVARILTGVGMGGEYPLASAHSAESTEDSGNGGRNVALLYLFGSGGGPALCDLVTYFLDLSGMPSRYIWRTIFAFGAVLSFGGLVLRFFTTRDSEKHINAVKSERVTQARTGKSARCSFLGAYWKPLLGTASIWLLFDIVEYGLKQNDAAIFAADKSGPYRNSVLTVFFTRLLAIPSLAIAPLLLKLTRSKWVQAGGFCGCILANFALAMFYDELHTQDAARTVLFDSLYVVQLSFQSLPGVTCMAIPAEIFPSAVRGTGAGISAASGKVGAVLGSYYFTKMKNNGQIAEIFWVVTCTSTVALVLTMLLTPLYSGGAIDRAEALAADGQMKEACKVLYSDPQGCEKGVPGVGEGDSNVEA
jgi:PHS family inorganic phosphate transporter-like MFS transporter